MLRCTARDAGFLAPVDDRLEMDCGMGDGVSGGPWSGARGVTSTPCAKSPPGSHASTRNREATSTWKRRPTNYCVTCSLAIFIGPGSCETWPALNSRRVPVKRVRMRRSWVTMTTAPR